MVVIFWSALPNAITCTFFLLFFHSIKQKDKSMVGKGQHYPAIEKDTSVWKIRRGTVQMEMAMESLHLRRQNMTIQCWDRPRLGEHNKKDKRLRKIRKACQDEGKKSVVTGPGKEVRGRKRWDWLVTVRYKGIWRENDVCSHTLLQRSWSPMCFFPAVRKWMC